MLNLLALMTIILWPVIPLFWIPLHGLSRIFKKLGLLTYIMPLFTWLPLAYLIYTKRTFILHYKLELPVGLNISGIPLLVLGTLLHIWTGKLLGIFDRTTGGIYQDKREAYNRGTFFCCQAPNLFCSYLDVFRYLSHN